MKLSTNISNLRFLDIELELGNCNVTLDITKEFPLNMTVYDVTSGT